MNKQDVDFAIECLDNGMATTEYENTALTALKFMRLMMEPSDELLYQFDRLDLLDYEIQKAVQACLKEVQGE